MSALFFAVSAVTGAAVGRAVRSPRTRPTVPAGVVPTAFRTRAAVQHADGTATCGDCGAHIPTNTEDAYKPAQYSPYEPSAGKSTLKGRQADHLTVDQHPYDAARIGGEGQ